MQAEVGRQAYEQMTYLDPKLLVILREARGFSVRQLAQRSGHSASTISRIERGHRIARPSTILALAKALNVAPGVLIRDVA